MSPTDQNDLDVIHDIEKQVIFTTMHSDEFDEGLDLCKQFAEHENEWVRRATLEGLSHLSRVHKKMDLDFAVPFLAKSLKDQSRIVRGEAEGTLDDFEVFLLGFTWEKHGLERPYNPADFRFDDDDDDDETPE